MTARLGRRTRDREKRVEIVRAKMGDDVGTDDVGGMDDAGGVRARARGGERRADGEKPEPRLAPTSPIGLESAEIPRAKNCVAIRGTRHDFFFPRRHRHRRRFLFLFLCLWRLRRRRATRAVERRSNLPLHPLEPSRAIDDAIVDHHSSRIVHQHLVRRARASKRLPRDVAPVGVWVRLLGATSKRNLNLRRRRVSRDAEFVVRRSRTDGAYFYRSSSRATRVDATRAVVDGVESIVVAGRR